jgi:hypothetical protein
VVMGFLHTTGISQVTLLGLYFIRQTAPVKQQFANIQISA